MTCFFLWGAPAVAQETLTVNFTTTQGPSPNYGTRNVVAVWVESNSDSFIKTIGRWASGHAKEMTTWVAAAGSSDSDAVMGSTRSNHSGTLTAVWDMNDRSGSTVPDGTYKIRFESADRNNGASSNIWTTTFDKDGVASTTTDSGGGFQNVEMVYTGRPTPDSGVDSTVPDSGADSSQPDSSQPDSSQPADSALPADSSQPADSTQPADSSQPVDSAQPADSSQPDSAQPTDGAPPVDAPASDTSLGDGPRLDGVSSDAPAPLADTASGKPVNSLSGGCGCTTDQTGGRPATANGFLLLLLSLSLVISRRSRQR